MLFICWEKIKLVKLVCFCFCFQKTPFIAVFIYVAPPASYDYVLGRLICLHCGGYLRLGKEAGERDYLREITIAQKMLMI